MGSLPLATLIRRVTLAPPASGPSEGGDLTSPSPFLINVDGPSPVLATTAGKLHICQPLSCPEDTVGQQPSPTYGSYNLFTSSSPAFPGRGVITILKFTDVE